MKNKGQMGVIIIVVLIIIVGVFFLYKEGYLNFNTHSSTTGQSVNPYVPISLNISSASSLSHVYTNESINVISNVFNHGKSYITVTMVPFGCTFLPTQNKSIAIPPNSPSSFLWTFSSSSIASCSITFRACFNAVSYTDYPLTIESYNFAGSVPVSSQTSSSGLPISIALQSFNNTVIAGPNPLNDTEYVAGNALTSDGSASALNWVEIRIDNGIGYFTASTGKTYGINPAINISSQEYPLTFQSGKLSASVPFLFVVNPVSNSLGYTSNVSINVSAGYRYCILSNSIPITINQP
jgi:hypothetical protein